MSDLGLNSELYGLSHDDFKDLITKVCVRVGNSNFADVYLGELPVIVGVLLRFGFVCTVHKIND